MMSKSCSDQGTGKAQRLNWQRALLIFLTIYLLLLIIWVPARFLQRHVLPTSAPLTLSEANGTLWRGGIERISHPFLTLKGLQWHWLPTALLQAQIGAAVDAGDEALAVSLGVGLDRALQLRDLRFDGPLSAWMEFPLPLSAQLQGGWADLQLDAEGCSSSSVGELRVSDWQGVSAALFNSLGTVTAALACQDGQLQAELSSDAADLALQGRLILAMDGSYRLSVQLRPAPATREDWLDLGFAARGGVLQLQRQGRL